MVTVHRCLWDWDEAELHARVEKRGFGRGSCSAHGGRKAKTKGDEVSGSQHLLQGHVPKVMLYNFPSSPKNTKPSASTAGPWGTLRTKP